MAGALRSVYALMDIQVKGADKLVKANQAIDQFVAKASTRARGTVAGPGGTLLGIGGPPAAAGGGTADVGGVGETASRSVGGMVALGAAIAATVLVIEKAAHAIVSMVEGVIDLGTRTVRTSRELSISTEDVQRWGFIAQHAGLEADSLNFALSRMQREAFKNSGRFAAMGINVRDSSGRIKNASVLFEETGLALANIRDPAERAARAQQIFGRSARTLLPIFSEGAGGITELSARFRQLGGGLTDDVIGQAREAHGAMVDFDLATTGLKGTLVGLILPALRTVVGWLTQFAGWLKTLFANSAAVHTILIMLGAAAAILVVSFAPLIATVVGIVAGLAALYLIVQDVITAFEGGDSVLGPFIEKLLHTLGIQGSLKEIGEQLWATIKKVGAAFLEWGGYFLSNVLPAIVFNLKLVWSILEPIIKAAKWLLSAMAGIPSAFGLGDTSATEAALTAQRLLAQPTVPAPTGGGGAVHVNNAPVINVTGIQDPESVGRAVAQHVALQNRRALELVPRAGGRAGGGGLF
jgi:hypothetical protein